MLFRPSCVGTLLVTFYARIQSTQSAVAFRQPQTVSRLPGSIAGDPCFEAHAESAALSKVARHKQAILDLYQAIFAECGSGIHNLVCVSKAQFAEKPGEWYALCLKEMGPQPAASESVCVVSRRVVGDLASLAERYAALSRMMDLQQTDCLTLPLACIFQADQCLDQPDMHYCFNQCLRTGSMDHAMSVAFGDATGLGLTPGGNRYVTGAIVPSAQSTTPRPGGTTFTRTWWQKIIDVVGKVIGVDTNGV